MAALPYMQNHGASRSAPLNSSKVMRFKWGEYYADTMHMDAEQHGACLLIIAAAWKLGRPVPHEKLKLISRCANHRWQAVQNEISDLFHISDEGWTPKAHYEESGRLKPGEWAKIRIAVFERDGYTCTYCGSAAENLECDHIHPVSRGGGNSMRNLTTSCEGCNRSKGAKTPEEWVRHANV